MEIIINMKLFLAIFGVTLASSSVVSLKDIMGKKVSSVKEDLNQPVVKGFDDFTVSEDNFDKEMRESFEPCGGQELCGEAQRFQNQAQYKTFVEKYTQPINQNYLKGDFNIARGNIIDFGNHITGSSTMANFQSAQNISFGNKNSVPSSSNFAKSAPQPVQGRDFSGTNNQVSNVDEADLLKTDGTYIYTISGNTLNIVLAYPASRASVVSKIEITQLQPQGLFIQGDYLAVFGTDYNEESYSFDGNYNLKGRATGYRPYYNNNREQYTKIRIYDLSNRAKPFLSKTFKVAGRYTNGRKTENGYVYLIANQSLRRNYRPWYDDGFGRLDIAWNSIYYYPSTYNSVQLTNIISFDLANPNNKKKIVSLCGETSSIMYMSDRNIYLTNTKYENSQTYTTIKKIYVRRNKIIPFADGKVKGTINNQFSLDEFGPYLRVAATISSGPTSCNSVYTLGYYLKPYGKLENIAPGERIFSARYMEKRLYLVTFRQVDPFFAISLQNHKKPKILGELKVPGFSRYLHPFDDDTIIGFGRQADNNGRQQGLKVSMFDVSDVKKPTELAKMELEEHYASSTAQFEHKAFLLSPEKNMMVVPISMNNGNKDDMFNGAMAIHISKQDKQIVPKAAIDHLVSKDDNFYDRNVDRSLYIEELLYTKSKCLIRINKINEDFEGAKDINLCEPVPKTESYFRVLPRYDYQTIQLINGIKSSLN